MTGSYDLSNIYINFTLVPKGTRIVDHFPELKAFPEFERCDENRIKIAILTGDIDSPFVRTNDRELMVRSVFDYLGISIKTKNEKEFFSNVVSFKDTLTTFAWTRYLQILHETDFTNWLLAKRDYDFFLSKSNEGQKEGETDKAYLARRNEVRRTVKELGDEVREIEAKLFPDSKAAREAAIAESNKKIKLYAEQYAEPFGYI